MKRPLSGRLAGPLRRLHLVDDERGPVLGAGTVITLRLVPSQDDDPALERLVQLSGVARPHGASLVAEVDGEARAALALDGKALFADPFHPAEELGSLLTLRLAQLEAAPGSSPDLRCA